MLGFFFELDFFLGAIRLMFSFANAKSGLCVSIFIGLRLPSIQSRASVTFPTTLSAAFMSVTSRCILTSA